MKKLILFIVILLYFTSCKQNIKESPKNKIVIDTVNTNHKIGSFQFLTNQELQSKSKEQLRLLRNEVFAHKGFVFKNKELNDYFKNKSWYTPNPNIKISLSKKEQEYIDRIKKIESYNQKTIIDTVKTKTITKKEKSPGMYNFDSILECGYYSYNTNFFVTADYGCIYQKGKNDFGNISIYLIPKKVKGTPSNKIESYERYVNKLDIKNLKKEFTIYVFLVDKKYIVDTPEGPYQGEKFVRDLYKWDNKNWIKVDSFVVNNENDEIEERKWYKNKVKDFSK